MQQVDLLFNFLDKENHLQKLTKIYKKGTENMQQQKIQQKII